MRKARNRFERIKQITGWLNYEWPVGRPIEVIWVREVIEKDEDTEKRHQCYGQTYRKGRGLVIELSLRKCRTWEGSSETLMHEWVHAVLWGPATLEHNCDHHPVQFYALEGQIVERWNHDHGWEQANEFDFT